MIGSNLTCNSASSEPNYICLTLILTTLNYPFQLEIDEIPTWDSDWFLNQSKFICWQEQVLERVISLISIITSTVTSNQIPPHNILWVEMIFQCLKNVFWREILDSLSKKLHSQSNSYSYMLFRLLSNVKARLRVKFIKNSRSEY